MKQLTLTAFFITILFLNSCQKTPELERLLTPILPTIETIPVSNVTNERALSGCKVSNKDTTTIIEAGIVWGPASLPTVDLTTKASLHTDTSYYSFYMTDLNCSTQYFVRAYAITLSRDTIYGNQLEFTTNSYGGFIRQLHLSKTHSIDTIIQQFFVSKMYPSAGASFLNNLSLPQGIYMYVKFDSAVNLRCYNGITSQIYNTGDTMHFGPFDPRGFPAESAITVFPVIDYLNPYSVSEGWFSIHVAGIAVSPDNTYKCNFFDGGYGPTTTTHQSIYLSDTSRCASTCEFQ